MKVKAIIHKLHNEELSFGVRVKILSISSLESGRGCLPDKELEGMTGTLTNPFSGFPVEGIGIFLENPTEDCCNLGLEDEITILE